ncbi:GFA family protein [Limimaricola pyoseonensis]|uniref:Uncharacterized conserved protein n=1 Tax=Limimaricola pyoseonensis TaxID=521013 RepID=A0A1G7CUQ5_9RHOB|nr:GFA family protein [Limimaricola pyoseonensis]SDE42490.1 Uncharacterized conserved protein [Limimaricola pyoseonensis]
MSLKDPVHRLTCHCGAVELRLHLKHGLGGAHRCDCSFCRRRGAIAAPVDLDQLEVVKGQDALTLYQWGTKTARHWFCATCGIYTHHQRRSNPNEYSVNVAAIEGVNPRDLGDVPWSDGVNHVCDRPEGR